MTGIRHAKTPNYPASQSASFLSAHPEVTIVYYCHSGRNSSNLFHLDFSVPITRLILFKLAIWLEYALVSHHLKLWCSSQLFFRLRAYQCTPTYCCLISEGKRSDIGTLATIPSSSNQILFPSRSRWISSLLSFTIETYTSNIGQLGESQRSNQPSAIPFGLSLSDSPSLVSDLLGFWFSSPTVVRGLLGVFVTKMLKICKIEKKDHFPHTFFNSSSLSTYITGYNDSIWRPLV